ncbi:Helicase SRCAP [Gossypium arboreum]|uniref:Helicase SRCAP n=1 Tax=Gossypium arboreum TaxID=29729 RepID=A0A0B0NJX0_GOSAR|nr:Helicase SRCAP [Gossypium arboreum]
MIISFSQHDYILSYLYHKLKITRGTIWNTKGYPISLTQEVKLLMPCPRHGLILAHMSRPMPCPRHGPTLALILIPMPCPRHCLTLALVSIPIPCPRHGLILALIMWPMPCPRHGLTLAHISTLMPCPRHALTLAFIMWPMPCPRHGLTLAHISTKCCGKDIQSISKVQPGVYHIKFHHALLIRVFNHIIQNQSFNT